MIDFYILCGICATCIFAMMVACFTNRNCATCVAEEYIYSLTPKQFKQLCEQMGITEEIIQDDMERVHRTS